jgi:NAD(P)-dependent dehydrogenase (short-subunit alcohol dehydrogenase family)
MHFDDLQSKSSYSPWFCYGQSKLANLLFTFELQRRSDAAGWGLVSDAAHPGFALTELIANGPGANSFMARISNLLIMPWASQSAAEGALPILFAATSPQAVNGGYYGPDGFYEMKGAPKAAQIARAANDPTAAARLWQISEELTGVTFPSS